MLTHLLSFWVYWGIWLIVPFLIDGVIAIALFFGMIVARLKKTLKSTLPVYAYQPIVSIIIPVANGEEPLATCLASIKRQTYPAHMIEVVVVDNGSTDGTARVFFDEQNTDWGGQMQWISVPFRGKPWALNVGIHMTMGQYIINIDADVILAPNAIEQMVTAFEANPSISAATGAIEILPSQPENGPLAYLIAECEYQEYLSAFWMGRQYQSLTNSLFTLAGAFSAFRREALLRTFQYDKMTVSEDTKLTLDFYKMLKGMNVVCVPTATAYITPTPTLSLLYAQRVRWQRGQLEVAALNLERVNLNILQLRGLSLSRLLIIDHTLLFPRLVWIFLFPMLISFDYPLSLIVNALLFMYAFYALVSILTTLVTYIVSKKVIRTRLLKNWWISLLMPIYRFLTFVYRLAGSIITLTEPAVWHVEDPISGMRRITHRPSTDIKID